MTDLYDATRKLIADRIAVELNAEQRRPSWYTGADVAKGDYAGCSTALFDPSGRPRAFAVDGPTAAELADAMTVLIRLEAEGVTEAELATRLRIAEAERDRLRADLDLVREERNALRTNLLRAATGARYNDVARRQAESTVEALRRHVADLERQIAELTAAISSALSVARATVKALEVEQ